MLISLIKEIIQSLISLIDKVRKSAPASRYITSKNQVSNLTEQGKRKQQAKKILLDYETHYEEAKKLFISEASRELTDDTTGVKIHIVYPQDKDDLIKLPDNYLSLVKRIHQDVDLRFQESENCLLFPKPELEELPRYTQNISEIHDGKVIALRLKNWLNVDGLETLCSLLISQIERKIYHSYAFADKIYFQRSLISSQATQSSWLWHYDNHPNVILKLMIYLTDVDEESAPFEYIRSTQFFEPVMGVPILPRAVGSRISLEKIEEYLQNGFECHKVIGPRGTIILFDNNIIHRANFAKLRTRDTLVLQIRPCTFKPHYYAEPRWTGSFEDEDFNFDPYVVKPQSKVVPKGSIV